jgi:hypothetical protein
VNSGSVQNKENYCAEAEHGIKNVNGQPAAAGQGWHRRNSVERKEPKQQATDYLFAGQLGADRVSGDSSRNRLAGGTEKGSGRLDHRPFQRQNADEVKIVLDLLLLRSDDIRVPGNPSRRRRKSKFGGVVTSSY